MENCANICDHNQEWTGEVLQRPKQAEDGQGATSDRVYTALRLGLIEGRIIPGRSVTLRGIAQDLGVSPMPVRAAVARLVAERALSISDTRRVSVPALSEQMLDELMQARLVLEPEAAARAINQISTSRLDDLRRHDERLEACLVSGDVGGYMTANHAFHFGIYSAAPSAVFVPLIEQLWLQFGPFMRVVYGRVGTAKLVDQHEVALTAIERKDGEALRAAIAADIRDGMTIIGRAMAEK
jgi:DNA-binding GntR family transcriptional regulator